MGRNAAFGRPPALDRVRSWWQELDPGSRTNALLAVGVGALVLGILVAAVSRDTSPTRAATTVIRPPMQPPISGFSSTVVIDGLNTPGTPTSSSSTTTTTPPAATTTVTTPTRATTPTVATTAAPAPAPTVTNPDVVFNDVTTTVPAATTTAPTSTLAPPTSVRPTTTTTPPLTLPLPLGLPRLVEP